MTTTPAGWYPDPGGSGGVRWWDGAAWGEQLQAAPQPVAQPWGATDQHGGGAAGPQQWGPGQPAQPGPRTTLPGFAPVCLPSLRTCIPFTNTWSTPVASCLGFSNVA